LLARRLGEYKFHLPPAISEIVPPASVHQQTACGRVPWFEFQFPEAVEPSGGKISDDPKRASSGAPYSLNFFTAIALK
jgi:hypothetical protein